MEAALFNASTLSLWWVFPFAGFLLTLAFAPLLASDFWHRHEVKIIATFCGLTIVPMLAQFGFSTTSAALSRSLGHDYIPFILLISSLFVVCGGVHITTKGDITPLENTAFLLCGSIIASLIGTTGASILLIRPFLSMNHHRFHKKYLVIFFIFTISNIGGCLTPIGDPPLFLGFLNGVSFFWPLQHLILPFLGVTLPLLLAFYAIDHYHYRKNPKEPIVVDDMKHVEKVTVYGKLNIFFLGLILLTVVLSGMNFQNIDVKHIHFARDIALFSITVASFWQTPRFIHHMNGFSFEPLREVALVFLAVFITLVPIEAMLHLGVNGAFRDITALANPGNYADPLRYYLLTGFLSSFLDNAPTYLLFFHMAGGDAASLMTTQVRILTAISTGAVFFGAMTYIGNAPNFMVKAIAERMHIKMPSFLGYMAWSLAILLPILLGFGLIVFR